MTEREALKLALEALEAAYARLVTKCEQNLVTYNGVDVDTLTLSQEAITAIKEALSSPNGEAQPEQEPVAWVCHGVNGEHDVDFDENEIDALLVGTMLYTTPPQRKPLTDEEIILIVAECAASHQHTDIHFARAIERAHGIKGLV